MTIKQVILASVAMSALSVAPALAASAPPIAVVAAHPGNMHVKTAMHAGKVQHLTSTINISTSVSTSRDYKKKTPLPDTFYTYLDSGSYCNRTQKVHLTLPTHKTKYAYLSKFIETITGYCSTAPTKFYGTDYTLETKKAVNKVDSFRATLVGTKIHYDGRVYDINVNLDTSVDIGS